MLRRDDWHLGIGLDHSEHAAEVIQMRVRIDHRGDWPVAPVRAVHRQGGCRALLRGKWIDDDHASTGLDQRHVRKVGAADLVDAGSNLVQPLESCQLTLAPQARMDRLRASARRDEPELVRVKYRLPVSARDHGGLKPGNQPALGVLEVGPVGKVGGHARLQLVVVVRLAKQRPPACRLIRRG